MERGSRSVERIWEKDREKRERKGREKNKGKRKKGSKVYCEGMDSEKRATEEMASPITPCRSAYMLRQSFNFSEISLQIEWSLSELRYRQCNELWIRCKTQPTEHVDVFKNGVDEKCSTWQTKQQDRKSTGAGDKAIMYPVLHFS